MNNDNVTKTISDLLNQQKRAPQADRVALFNALSRALAAELLFDLPADPALRPQLLEASSILDNDYNPNRTADTEIKLLETSMLSDGITMGVVTAPKGGVHVVVDGFHRKLVATTRLERKYIPCAVIDKPQGDLMAATVRHNRARGKHQVDLQAALVVSLAKLGMPDEEISHKLGLSAEELLRLKQLRGSAARLIAGVEYSSTYGRTDEPPNLLDQ